ncbi:hypothetical protein CHS0354_012965 [Potamilus streckersoni]|uniref:Uncharacterized protein n=1 Tax=Potamilus streckersoni TaxID=2493646 RepID=A0AAE0SM24_9BIVA|nr:hypothetical protein CHS0354_012965 [Potamilus streckersoni]
MNTFKVCDYQEFTDLNVSKDISKDVSEDDKMAGKVKKAVASDVDLSKYVTQVELADLMNLAEVDLDEDKQYKVD